MQNTFYDSFVWNSDRYIFTKINSIHLLFDFLVNLSSYLSFAIYFCIHSPLENIKGLCFYVCKCKSFVLAGFEDALHLRDPPDSLFIDLLRHGYKEILCFVMALFLFSHENEKMLSPPTPNLL